MNLTLTQAGTTSTIGWVPDVASCPADVLAWYYDDPDMPTAIILCPSACDAVTSGGGTVEIKLGCASILI